MWLFQLRTAPEAFRWPPRLKPHKRYQRRHAKLPEPGREGSGYAASNRLAAQVVRQVYSRAQVAVGCSGRGPRPQPARLYTCTDHLSRLQACFLLFRPQAWPTNDRPLGTRHKPGSSPQLNRYHLWGLGHRGRLQNQVQTSTSARPLSVFPGIKHAA